MNGKDIMKSCRQSAEYNAKFQAHLDKIYQDEPDTSWIRYS